MEEEVMKNTVKKLVVAVIFVFSISLLLTNAAQAKTKKLKVNTVYTTSKKIKGTTKLKKAKVVAKIGKKTYKAKSNRKGKFTIKIKKKRKKGTKIKVTVYRKKKSQKKYKYASITIKVKTKSKIPKKTDAIDYEQFLKDYNKVVKTGKDIDKNVGDYRYQIYTLGYVSIGYPSEYMEHSANGVHVTLKAKNGATLYYTIGAKGNFDFDAPTLTKYDGMLKPGQTKKWEGWDFKEGELIKNNLYIKVCAYKDGKLVAIIATTKYLIQGYADWMFK